MYCKNCRIEVKEGARFCPICGSTNSLSSEKPAKCGFSTNQKKRMAIFASAIAAVLAIVLVVIICINPFEDREVNVYEKALNSVFLDLIAGDDFWEGANDPYSIVVELRDSDFCSPKMFDKYDRLSYEEKQELSESFISGLKLHKALYHYHDLTETGEVTFDKNGKLLSASESEDSGPEFECIYDGDGNLLSYVDLNRDGSVCQRHEYTYDDDGNMISCVQYDEDGSVCGRYEYTYDDDGNVLSYVRYGGDGSVSRREKYTYDSKGNLLVYDSGYSVYKYYWNNGKPEKVERYRDGKLNAVSELIYY